jgi:hypothetical protein
MTSISRTKWFTHAKILECDEARRQCNWLSVRRLVNEWALKPKAVAYIIREAGHHVACIGVFKTFFKHHLMAFNKHSFSL